MIVRKVKVWGRGHEGIRMSEKAMEKHKAMGGAGGLRGTRHVKWKEMEK